MTEPAETPRRDRQAERHRQRCEHDGVSRNPQTQFHEPDSGGGRRPARPRSSNSTAEIACPDRASEGNRVAAVNPSRATNHSLIMFSPRRNTPQA